MFELRTARLLLRDLVEDDWPTIYAMSQAAAVTHYQSWLRLASETEARQWVRQAMYHNQLQPRWAYNLAIVQLDPPEAIGWLGWGRPSDRSRGDYDFGYALLPSAWGHGYMTEALHAALGYMFESLAATCVSGECAGSNRASARVMEKAGMTIVRQWEECDQATGTTETQYRYALQAVEWRQHDTGDEELVENAPGDYYWGIGADGSGKNMLGKILMEVREELRRERKEPD